MANPTPWSSSSFAYEWTYDVFLSFRGEDTRTGFTGNLYHALRQKEINTFMDDQELRKGEEITPALMKAIQESRIAIVVFSENYASSTFCLKELTEIMEWFKHKGRLVWPVFYKVDPSDVRHQKGSYGEALAKHQTRISDKDRLKQWRLALQEAASLSGSHFKQGYEYEFIQKIIQEVSKRINRSPLDVANFPVGLESRVHELKSLLDIESNDGVHMVGIYGIGGVGKTTLACAVYNFIADHFEGYSFLFEVRENSMKHGMVHLQETLLSDILGEKDIKLGNVKKGIPIIKRRLCKKKILLILDDVDKKEQLEVLAGGLDWFGSGSRIIITTRDIHLLHLYRVDRTYEAAGLNLEEALELFSWNAFKTKLVNHSYLDISKRVILHSNGLPLSLEIIGSDLFGKTVLEWKSALDVYERIPHENILEILKVSFDGLKEYEKEIFLDMACFFKGYKLSDVKNILHSGRGLAPDYAIKVLIDKCLIKIETSEFRVRFHNLIENMGREIVRQESPSKPGERSRLWFSEDILHVFKKNKGSDKTEIIMLYLPKEEDVRWDGNALRKMENLKILVVENARFSRAPTVLPNSLRVLIWWGYPESSLPADFDTEELVILDLRRSFITFENQLNMKFKSLTEMNLSGCDLLKKIPDMSGASNLKELNLKYCRNLLEVHDSVGFLDKLEWLELSNCTSLRILPREINLPSLRSMHLEHCTSLMSFPEVSGKMENIKWLELNWSGIRDLPFSIGNFTGLEGLRVVGCKWLLELPSSIFMLPDLWLFTAAFCESLAEIKNGNSQDQETMCSSKGRAAFDYCLLTDKFLDTLIPCLRTVKKLSLNYTNITILPSSISACLSVTTILLNECKELREIRGLPPNIINFSAINCTSLTSESKGMLLNQTLHEARGRHFEFPGSIIPSWFSGRGPSMRFWFRNEYPAITLCGIRIPFTPFDNSDNRSCFYRDYGTQTEHTILFDPLTRVTPLSVRNYDFMALPAIKTRGEPWNYAETLFEDEEGRSIYVEWGLHVWEQKTNMEDFELTNPDISVAEK